MLKPKLIIFSMESATVLPLLENALFPSSLSGYKGNCNAMVQPWSFVHHQLFPW